MTDHKVTRDRRQGREVKTIIITLDLFHQTIVSDVCYGSSDGDERWLQSTASLYLYRASSHVTHHVTRWHVRYVTLLMMTIIRHQKPAMHLTYDYYFRYGCVSDGGAGWIVPHVY